MTEFMNGDLLSAQGQKVIEFIEQHIAEHVRDYNEHGDLAILNNMSGHYKHYYVHVYNNNVYEGMNKMSAREWAREYPGAMKGAYDDMQYLSEQAAQAQQIEQTAEETKSLAEQIEALTKQLAEAVEAQQAQAKELEALKEAQPKRGRKAKDAEPEAPAVETTTEGDTDTEEAE